MKRFTQLLMITIAAVSLFPGQALCGQPVFDQATSMTLPSNAPPGYRSSRPPIPLTPEESREAEEMAAPLADSQIAPLAATTLGKYNFKNKSTHCIDVYVDGEYQGSLNPPNKAYRTSPYPKVSGWVKTTKATSHEIYGEDCADKGIYWPLQSIYLSTVYTLTFID